LLMLEAEMGQARIAADLRRQTMLPAAFLPEPLDAPLGMAT